MSELTIDKHVTKRTQLREIAEKYQIPFGRLLYRYDHKKTTLIEDLIKERKIKKIAGHSLAFWADAFNKHLISIGRQPTINADVLKDYCGRRDLSDGTFKKMVSFYCGEDVLKNT